MPSPSRSADEILERERDLGNGATATVNHGKGRRREAAGFPDQTCHSSIA